MTYTLTDEQYKNLRSALGMVEQRAAEIGAWLDEFKPDAPPVVEPPVVIPPVVIPPTPAIETISGDDFTSYLNTAALQQQISKNAGGTNNSLTAFYGDGHNGQWASIDKSVLYDGHQTLRYDQPAGTEKTPALWHYLKKGIEYRNVWFRAFIRFSAGFSTRGITPREANAYKLLGLGWVGDAGRATLEITNTDEYQENWNSIGNDKIKRSGPIVFAKGPRITTEWTDQRWYQYLIHYEQTSNTAIRQRWWMAPDGEAPVFRGEVQGKMTLGVVPSVGRVMLGLNFNSARTKAQSLWYGRWDVVDGSKYANPFGVQL